MQQQVDGELHAHRALLVVVDHHGMAGQLKAPSETNKERSQSSLSCGKEQGREQGLGPFWTLEGCLGSL